MNTELLKSIEETERHLAGLKSQLKEDQKSTRLWQPDEDGDYWHVDITGEVAAFPWGGSNLDSRLYGNHNVYPSYGVAKKASALIRRSNLVISACLQIDPDFDPDWDRADQGKWSARYRHDSKKWDLLCNHEYQIAAAYVSSKGKGIELIEMLNVVEKGHE